MPAPLISEKARIAPRNYFVTTTLRDISDAFEGAGVARDEYHNPDEKGERRRRVEQYYKTLDWTSPTDAKRFIGICEEVLGRLERRAAGNDMDAMKDFDSLREVLEKDGFVFAKGRLVPKASSASLNNIVAAAGPLDLPELQRQISRLEEAIDNDPALAIGTAKALVETVCKTILEQRGIQVPDHPDIGVLVKETRKALRLLPEDVPGAARGTKSVRLVLSSLGSIVQGLGELRNRYGTGHGKVGSTRGLGHRHARLAVGAASTLAVFLLETHAEQNPDQGGSSSLCEPEIDTGKVVLPPRRIVCFAWAQAGVALIRKSLAVSHWPVEAVMVRFESERRHCERGTCPCHS